ncbi:MAG: NAD-dependent epimerase/dehydratase family protein [bacterium]|nr:NAD-dependent epimerase/dehydratase family protein [bacterium]
MKALVTGGAGFIGSTLTDRLLADGHEVVVYDNFSTGRALFLAQARRHAGFHLVRGDTLDDDALRAAMRGCDIVFHLAANADVRYGTLHPRKDFEQNTVATFNVLEAMRDTGVRRIVFASTGSIYGEPRVFPTPEDAPFPVQTSLYGASKLACEGLIEAYCEGYGIQGYIFRLVSILGERYTHGHVFDFYKALRCDCTRLRVLGDGHQRKSYLYVHDCIEGMLCALARAQERINIFNLGRDDYCEVNDSVRWICEALGVQPELEYTGGPRGWVGDSPFIFLDCRKIRQLGWTPQVSIREGVLRTLAYLQAHAELLEERA